MTLYVFRVQGQKHGLVEGKDAAPVEEVDEPMQAGTEYWEPSIFQGGVCLDLPQGLFSTLPQDPPPTLDQSFDPWTGLPS